jgi:putative ABC transport system permease protein
VTIAAALEQAYPDTNHNQSVAVMSEMQERVLRNPTNTALVAMLMTLAALVFLVACANLANLLMGRAHTHTREIATRLAIGAGRMRLVRQLLAESLAIALAGGAVSLLFAAAGTAFLGRFRVPSDLPLVISVKIDQRVLVFSLAVSLFSAGLFGLVPAVQAGRANLMAGVEGQRSRRRPQAPLLGTQRVGCRASGPLARAYGGGHDALPRIPFQNGLRAGIPHGPSCDDEL